MLYEVITVVPLIVHVHLIGFIVLARSPAQLNFNWEDSDLIKTAGRQAAVVVGRYRVGDGVHSGREGVVQLHGETAYGAVPGGKIERRPGDKSYNFV